VKEYKLFFLHFNVHFTGGPGLAGSRMSSFWILLELRVMVLTTGAVRRAKLQSLIPQTNQHPTLLQSRCPSCHPTSSVKALKGIKITSLTSCRM